MPVPQVFELVCAGTAYYFQASNTAEWVYYILDMLNKRAGEEAEANKAQMALSTSGEYSPCTTTRARMTVCLRSPPSVLVALLTSSVYDTDFATQRKQV